MEENDFDDDFDGDFEGDEHELEALRPRGHAINWRRVEVMKEQLLLRKQLIEFDDSEFDEYLD